MLKQASVLALSAFLCSTVVFGFQAPPSGGASPIVSGNGRWMDASGNTIGFEVSAVALPDGSIKGHGLSTRNSPVFGLSWFHFDVVDVVFIGDEAFVVGIVTAEKNTPGNWVGTWTLLAIHDGGQSAPDQATAAVGIPSSFTLAQVESALVLPPPLGPPPVENWPALTAGDFKIH